ncbi:MAG: amino acid adenylation domain-containing protein, partial [Okeania sp. SIO3I5]|uniref:non-ribosomal peptide synthetase n=1 Tax=Okeania sp. SIO3I5 TaxID=2607805 RepID=UPI0013BC02AE
LLSRYSGEERVVFGVTVSGRTGNISGVEKMVGLFINTLPLMVRISQEENLISWLEGIQESMLKVQDYSYTPLFEVQSRSEIPGGMPLFESIVIFENYPMQKNQESEKDSIQLSSSGGFEHTNYPLTVVAVPGDKLLVRISYDTVVFEKETIERLLGHLDTIFSAIVENPEQMVGELPLLTETERHQLLVEWNNTQTEYPQDKCAHQLFEEQVELNPDAIALVFEEKQLTYQQLNNTANQLAYYLQSLGISSEVKVGVCLERSVEMIVGILGILKAGGAYVPIDPNYPTERLSYMLNDSGIKVLLTTEKLLSSIPSTTAQIVCLDRDQKLIEQQSQSNLDTGVSSKNLAYVIYTSGSTGKPKGVAIEHQSLCNLVQEQKRLFEVTPESRILQFASISFDASVWEIFMAVTHGSRLILGEASQLLPGDDLKQIMERSWVTHVTLPPSALAVLPSSELPTLDKIIVAGEACPRELAHQWSVGRHFFNAYGPTESTVCATVAEIDDGSEQISIGRPIGNTKIYILDNNLQPVPIGVTGEMYIGGDGLARGYLNRPELTTEKFIPNPFAVGSLYRTGDLACYLPDGNIKFIGRIDNQVKVRGFRIELGEVEAVLNDRPQIQQAVVIVREDSSENKFMVAYVVPEDQSLNSSELKEDIKQKLPKYMVPSVFVFLESLPLTPNGKIDRKALPAPEVEIKQGEEYIAPRTETEEMIANIFASVLRVAKVGIYDNFFDLGGHSLLATQLVSQLKEALEIEMIPIKTIFEFPTVAELAQKLTQLQTIIDTVLSEGEDSTLNSDVNIEEIEF